MQFYELYGNFAVALSDLNSTQVLQRNFFRITPVDKNFMLKVDVLTLPN